MLVVLIVLLVFFFFVEEIDSLLSGLEFFFLSSRSDGNDLDYFLY